MSENNQDNLKLIFENVNALLIDGSSARGQLIFTGEYLLFLPRTIETFDIQLFSRSGLIGSLLYEGYDWIKKQDNTVEKTFSLTIKEVFDKCGKNKISYDNIESITIILKKLYWEITIIVQGVKKNEGFYFSSIAIPKTFRQKGKQDGLAKIEIKRKFMFAIKEIFEYFSNVKCISKEKWF